MPEEKNIIKDAVTIVERMGTYISDAQHIAVVMKGDALLRGNMHAYTSAQGAIDILLDLQMIVDGEKIPSLDEVKAEMEKANKKNVSRDTPYLG